MHLAILPVVLALLAQETVLVTAQGRKLTTDSGCTCKQPFVYKDDVCFYTTADNGNTTWCEVAETGCGKWSATGYWWDKLTQDSTLQGSSMCFPAGLELETENGCTCYQPFFIHKSQACLYTTDANDNVTWCYVKEANCSSGKNYDNLTSDAPLQGQSLCFPYQGTTTVKGCSCKQPFEYKGKQCMYTTQDNGNTSWCYVNEETCGKRSSNGLWWDALRNTSPVQGTSSCSEVKDSSSSGVPIVAIVVPITIAVVLLMLAIILFVLWRRKRRTKHNPYKQKSSAPLASRDSLGKPGNRVRYQGPGGKSDGPPLESMYSEGPFLDSIIMSASTCSDGSGSPSSVASMVIDVDSFSVCTNEDGSYQVLGEGAQSKVLLGDWQGQLVALKEIKRTAQRKNHIFDMIKEISIIKQCQHDNIVKLHGIAMTADDLLLMFEFMEGGDLYQAIQMQKEKYTWYNRGRDIAIQIAKGLEYLHSNRIVHCDMKTMNILLTKDGNAKIADMGMAKLMLHDLVTKGNNIGTWAYAAPELVLNSKITNKVDIYSFGVILWELATGERPMRGEMRKPSVPEECPEEVYNIIQACLSAEPDDRPSADKLVFLLERTNPGPAIV